jgi:type I restriction enzyme S subunit
LADLRAQHGEIPLRRIISSIEQGASPICEGTPAESGEWGVLKLSSVKRGRFYPEENKRLVEGRPQRRFQIREGDLLVTRANTPLLVGDVAVVRGAVDGKLLPDLIYRVGLSPNVMSDFVAEVLLGGRVRGLIEAVARGSSQSMVKVRGEDIKSWPIPRAGVREQEIAVRRIAESRDHFDSIEDRIARQVRMLGERRQALITAAVTGQIDVTTARGVS